MIKFQRIKIALAVSVVALLVGGSVAAQKDQQSNAERETAKLLKLAQKRGLYKIPPELRQQAIAWAMMKEISSQLGHERARQIRAAKTPSELHAYLQGSVNACKAQRKKCPVISGVFSGFEANSKGIDGKNYGAGIADAAKNWDVATKASCLPDGPVEPECGVFECLSNFGEHIGPCTAECGGMPGRFCPGEGGVPSPPETLPQ